MVVLVLEDGAEDRDIGGFVEGIDGEGGGVHRSGSRGGLFYLESAGDGLSAPFLRRVALEVRLV